MRPRGSSGPESPRRAVLVYCCVRARRVCRTRPEGLQGDVTPSPDVILPVAGGGVYRGEECRNSRQHASAPAWRPRGRRSTCRRRHRPLSNRLRTSCAASHASSISAARVAAADRCTWWHAFRRRPEPFTCEAPHDRGAVLSTDSASGCPGVRPRWHSPRSRHRTAVRPHHPEGCSKRAVSGHRMARLGCPKERSLHAKGLTPQDHGLQSSWHPPERRFSPTRFIRRHAPCLPQMLLLRRINAIR